MSRPTPPRPTTADFDPDVLALFDQYVHGLMDRRAFLGGVGRIVGSAGAVAVLAALTPQFAAAQQVKPDDARIHASYENFDSPKGYGKGRGYLTRPAKAAGPLPLVLVVHENRGLNPHIEDIARRFALEGFMAFAPDALFTLGGYPGEEDTARAKFGTLDQNEVREDFLAAADFLGKVKGGNGRMGAVGFCWGGGIANFLATHVPKLAAAAPFYGVAPALEDVPKIHAELLVVLAASDERVNATWPDFQKALDASGKRYALFQPADTVHGFNNDTTPRYNEVAAKEAWKRTLALFNRTLRKAN
jgi:carboxymethylenebutenolidase